LKVGLSLIDSQRTRITQPESTFIDLFQPFSNPINFPPRLTMASASPAWTDLFNELNRAVAKEQPEDVVQWGADWFQAQLKRDVSAYPNLAAIPLNLDRDSERDISRLHPPLPTEVPVGDLPDLSPLFMPSARKALRTTPCPPSLRLGRPTPPLAAHSAA